MAENRMFRYVLDKRFLHDVLLFTCLLLYYFKKEEQFYPFMASNIQITKVLQEYPKLQNLRGGWLIQKASGKIMIPNAFSCFILSSKLFLFFTYLFKRGSGQRKTTSLTQDSQSYTAKILKASSNNGKNVIYIVPLQEEINITPLPYDAPEFHNMPKNICMTCGTSVPLQLLPCQSTNAVSDISVSFTKK